MPATYDPTAHPLLSAGAAALSPEQLDAQAMIAEGVLGLHGTSLTGDDADLATHYVVRQLNLQVRMESSGGGSDVVAMSKGSQSFTFAQVDGRRVIVDEIALAGARMLVGTMGALSGSVTELTPVW